MRFLLGFISGALALAALSHPQVKSQLTAPRRTTPPPKPKYWNYHRLSQYDRVNLN